jgi:hypothetical protein
MHAVRGYGRGVLGALLVSMPLLAWWLGFYIPPLKMLLFLAVNFGLLVILKYYSGFQLRHLRQPEPALHVHLFPRYDWEPEEYRSGPAWLYRAEQRLSVPFDMERHGNLLRAIRSLLGTARAEPAGSVRPRRSLD